MTTTRSTTPSDPGDARSYTATGTRGGQFGDHNLQQNVFVGGRAPVTFPHLVAPLPPLASGRLDRAADAALESAVAGGEATAVVCQVVAGMGGVGKTQLAAGLAHRWWAERKVDLLVWATAVSRTGVQARFAQAAADVTGFEDPDPAHGAERFLAWLATTGHSWLIVLDDLADPAEMRGLWPPLTAAGRTVVTTRRRDAALVDGRRLVNVGVFTEREALDYLSGKLGARPESLAEDAQLARDLGGLPLALAQAAAYMLDQNLSCAGYRRRLARRPLPRLAPHLLPDGQELQVANAWALSLELADTVTDGLATPLLRIGSLLDPNGIPLGIFTTEAAGMYCADHVGSDVAADDIEDALRALHRLGLIEVEDTPDELGPGAARVHALVQRVTRDAGPAATQGQLVRQAADALTELWPKVERGSSHAQSLRSNTAVLASHPGDHLWSEEDGAHLALFRAVGVWESPAWWRPHGTTSPD
ncbi:NB-ARC domain-containing protein [Actinoplanes sp. NPDC051861]|uniref:NB-ARC domain-containing protein n=1 Tax=Actinoplanes sp. NPDC051861 TaxID=3155170 RepID=UPI003442FF23